MVPKVVRCRPNYFLGFRVNNPLVHQKSKEIQELAVNENPIFKQALTNLTNLHITLNVFHLPAEEDVNKVSTLLDQWATERIKEVFQDPIQITIRGIGYFSGGVIFASVERCENYSRLCSLADELNGLLVDAGYVGDKKKFSPHLTLLKLSKYRSLLKLRKEFKAVSEELMKTSPDFGIQSIQTIQLLSMTKKAPDGYYLCEHEISTPGSNISFEGKPPELSQRRSFHTFAAPSDLHCITAELTHIPVSDLVTGDLSSSLTDLPSSSSVDLKTASSTSSPNIASSPICSIDSDCPIQPISEDVSDDSPSS